MTRALVALDSEAGLGPAMRALPTDRWRTFVEYMVVNGSTAGAAAGAAGFSGDHKSLSANGSRLIRDPRIQAAIFEESIKLIRADGPMALRVLREIAGNKQAAARDRIKAATEILARGGLGSITQHNVNVTHHLSDAEKDREIEALATELGLDKAAQAALLGKPIIDADFVEIVDAAPVDRSTISTNPDRPAEARARGRPLLTPEEKQARHALRSAKAKAKYEAARFEEEDEIAKFIGS